MMYQYAPAYAALMLANQGMDVADTFLLPIWNGVVIASVCVGCAVVDALLSRRRHDGFEQMKQSAHASGEVAYAE